MSSKSKGKPDPRVKAAQLQQRRAMIENESYRTMVRMLKAFNAYEQFMQLSPASRKKTKASQFRSVVVKAAGGSQISAAILAAVKKDLSNYLNAKKIPLGKAGELFTLYEVITAGQTLWLEARHNTKDAPWVAIYQLLAQLNVYFEDNSQHISWLISDFLMMAIVPFSHIDKYFLWVTWEFELIDLHYTRVFMVHRLNCQRKHIVIDRKPRPVFKVGYPMQMGGMLWASVLGRQLQPLCPRAQADREYPVYVQSHALQRLRERLVPLPDLEQRLMLAFVDSEISRAPTGSLFFAVKYCGQKVGDLLTDFTGDALVARSFLFITNTGTAEGCALNDRLRVEAYSKKYFGLDALTTYLATDLCTDPFFGAILKECGCEGLVNIKVWLREIGLTRECKYSENLRRALALEEEEPPAGEGETADEPLVAARVEDSLEVS
jgi:hypothetical protein